METWDTLSPAALHTAAADLRNAAYLIDHAGHTKGLRCDSDGSLCLAGAIEAATFREVRTGLGRMFLVDVHDFDMESNYRRCNDAILALAKFVPTGMCNLCEPDHEPWATVTHYNDEHCPGGTVAANMLVLAAVSAEIVAEQRTELVPA